VSLKNERKIFKFNQDDILEILLEHLGEENDFDMYQSSGMLLGTPGKDLRLIVVIGDIDDTGINKLNLEEIEKEVDYNGPHVDLNNNFLSEGKNNK
jgi:hypothetical protein